MNSCVLMAKIVRAPQLRYTQDNQLAITEMMVEFDSSAPNSPPCTLKAIAWGNLATDIEQNYTEGNEVILTGRLKMDLVERQGYKEKIAELTISHLYPVTPTTTSDNVVSLNSYKSDDDSDLSANSPSNSDAESSHSQESDDGGIDSNDLDNIPF